MGTYFNKFYFMMVAIVTSYFVNMIYNINSALAAITCPDGRVCTEVENKWRCIVDNGLATATFWPSTGSSYHTQLGNGGNYCNSASAAAVMSQMVPSGYTLQGCIIDNAGVEGSSGRVDCSYQSCYSTAVSPTTKAVNCGKVTMCGTSTVTASCNTAGTPGFLTNGGKNCACCPQPTGAADYRPVSGVASVYTIYNASAMSSCYIKGDFKDETGLFRFTDDNRCYYAS